MATRPWPDTWTVNAFLERYPEFKYAGAMLPRALKAAAQRADPDHYGELTAEVVGLLTAIDLGGSPYSQTQKQDGDGAKITQYKERLTAIKLEKRIAYLAL